MTCADNSNFKDTANFVALLGWLAKKKQTIGKQLKTHVHSRNISFFFLRKSQISFLEN